MQNQNRDDELQTLFQLCALAQRSEMVLAFEYICSATEIWDLQCE
jgi:hypothetical protein